jgi:hypothetical protein
MATQGSRWGRRRAPCGACCGSMEMFVRAHLDPNGIIGRDRLQGRVGDNPVRYAMEVVAALVSSGLITEDEADDWDLVNVIAEMASGEGEDDDAAEGEGEAP